MTIARFTIFFFCNTKKYVFVHTLNTGFIRGDGSALNANVVLLDGLGGFNGNLIICLITVFHAKVEVLNVDIQVREDELVKDNKGEFNEEAHQRKQFGIRELLNYLLLNELPNNSAA